MCCYSHISVGIVSTSSFITSIDLVGNTCSCRDGVGVVFCTTYVVETNCARHDRCQYDRALYICELVGPTSCASKHVAIFCFCSNCYRAGARVGASSLHAAVCLVRNASCGWDSVVVISRPTSFIESDGVRRNLSLTRDICKCLAPGSGAA